MGLFNSAIAGQTGTSPDVKIPAVQTEIVAPGGRYFGNELPVVPTASPMRTGGAKSGSTKSADQ